ncbi:Uncharacterised protein [uncultured archaeon]|nr:Uncharacterised protein [uncultured archaeon]
MRLFKHGSSLAIVIPDNIIQRRLLKEGEELEFIDVDENFIALVKKTNLKNKIENKINEKTTLQPSKPIIEAVISEKNKNIPSFLIIDNEIEAREFSRRYENEIREKILNGVRSFDKKFYIIRNDYFEDLSKKIITLIEKNEMKLDDICQA